MAIVKNQRSHERVRRNYVQSVLSGFGGISEPKDKGNDNASSKSSPPTNPYFWQQKSYIVFVPFIVTETGISGDSYNYEIQVSLDVDVPIQPYKPRSKNLTGQVFNLDAEKVRAGAGLHMVYGVSTSGQHPLSLAADTPISEVLTHVYSRTMGTLNRAIERVLHFSGKAEQRESAKDPGKRKEESPTSPGIRATKTRGGSKKVLPEIRDETPAENPPSLDKTNGAILGKRPENGPGELEGVGNVPSIRDPA